MISLGVSTYYWNRPVQQEEKTQFVGDDIPTIESVFDLKSGARAKLVDRGGSMVIIEIDKYRSDWIEWSEVKARISAKDRRSFDRTKFIQMEDTFMSISAPATSTSKRTLTAALAAGDLQAAVAAFRQDIVFHSPILATVGDEVRGLPTLAKILQTAFTCLGMPQNVEEFQNSDGRYIVTFDGAIDGNPIQIAMLVTEDAEGKAESIRAFMRPWSVVKLFREYMERNLRPDPVSDPLWELPASKARR